MLNIRQQSLWLPWKREQNRAERRGPTVVGGGVSIAWLGIVGMPWVEDFGTVPTVCAKSLILRVVENRAAGLLGVQRAVLSPFVLDTGEGRRVRVKLDSAKTSVAAQGVW